MRGGVHLRRGARRAGESGRASHSAAVIAAGWTPDATPYDLHDARTPLDLHLTLTHRLGGGPGAGGRRWLIDMPPGAASTAGAGRSGRVPQLGEWAD